MKKDYTVKMEKDEWGKLLTHVYEHKKNEVKVDGFRKGQVPYDIYVKNFGLESLYMDAVDHALPELYDKMLEENTDLTFNMACRPEVDVKSISNDGLEIVFHVTMKPEVKLGKYKNLGIKKEEVSVSDEEIDHEIEHLRERYVEMKEIGKRISDRRKKLGIKQNILAEKLDISNNHMSGIENGKATPSVALFVKICDKLNVTPDFLLLGSMHSNRVSKDASDLLQKCSDQEIEMIMQLVQHFVELREQKVESDKISKS